MARKPGAEEDRRARAAQLRAEREEINRRIQQDRAKVRELSARIRELEPLPDRSGKARTGFSLKPASG